MKYIKSTVRTIGLLSVCLVAFGSGFFIATEQAPRHDPLPVWADEVCVQGRGIWGQAPTRRECWIIEGPQENEL